MDFHQVTAKSIQVITAFQQDQFENRQKKCFDKKMDRINLESKWFRDQIHKRIPDDVLYLQYL